MLTNYHGILTFSSINLCLNAIINLRYAIMCIKNNIIICTEAVS